MSIPIVASIGAALGALGALGIYFEPHEPYKHQILAAGTVRGALVALLTGYSLVGFGALYGVLFGGVIYLAKGGPASGDAPFVIPMSALTGALSGVMIVWLAL